MTATQTTQQAVEMILDVLTDGLRSDRYLRRSEDGELYTTPDKDFIGEDGAFTPPYVRIPHYDGSTDMTPEDLWDWAASLIDELDEQIG